MYDRGESGTSTEKPGNDFDSYFDAEQHCGGDHFSHGASCGWMPGGGRGRRRAMMMGMMSDPSGVYGMDHGHRFGFGGRGGRRGHGGSWFGFGGRGGRRGHGGSWFGFGDRGQRHGHGGRGRGRNGRGCGRFFVDDDDEYVTSMAEQMDDCHLEEGCKRDGSGSSESSSSSSSESDDEQNAPDVNVQGRQPHDGEVLETEGKATDKAQKETTKSNATELEKEKASSQHTCNNGKRGCRNGRGHHKHHHGKHKHHRHSAPHHSMIPPPHLLGFNRPTFPPMHHSHHRFPGCHGNRHMAKKFFKKSMKQWVKAQKRAWKQQQESHCCHHHRRQRSDEDEATSGCDNDDDFELPEGRCQLPPPWLFFPYDHHGCGHGRRGFGRHEKKGKKNGKRLRKCNGERPSPAEDTSATKTQVDAVDDVEKVHEVHDESENDQAPMEEAAE